MSAQDTNHTPHNKLDDLSIYKSFIKSNYSSLKLNSYFFAYEELFRKYRNKPITFVEIGIFNGGSLFMWRDFFGPQTRIIGIDFNPGAKKWEKDGFEIHTGDQADPEFWKSFFESVGPIDILLDDGGHTNEQQIITTMSCARMIKDGGLLVVEDTHTSYMRKFGNPGKWSFINFAKKMIDGVNSRYPAVPKITNNLTDHVYSITFYDSIVCFHINRQLCFDSTTVKNDGLSLGHADYRHEGTTSTRLITRIESITFKYLPLVHRIKLLNRFVKFIFETLWMLSSKTKSRKNRKHFK